MVSEDAARGAFVGLACGDALGRPIEFRSGKWITAEHGTVTEMVGYGTHGQPAGTVTDDTDLALCIARSLVEQRIFDGQDVAERFQEWYENGPFDIGLMTADAIQEFRQGTSWRDAGRIVWEQRSEGSNAGNGSVMRCAPHAIAFADDPATLVEVSKQSSEITHYDPRCSYGCAILNCTIAGFLRGDERPFEIALERVEADAPAELVEALRPIPHSTEESQLQTTGYVVHTLQTALYEALTADTAEGAITSAVNRGGDTDTVGAVTGVLAGARFGADAVPDRWSNTIDHRDDLRRLATSLVTSEIGSGA